MNLPKRSQSSASCVADSEEVSADVLQEMWWMTNYVQCGSRASREREEVAEGTMTIISMVELLLR